MTEQRKDQGGSPASPGKTTDANTVENQGYNQHGHGKGGKLGEGEPEGSPERDGSTQPNFGQPAPTARTRMRAHATEMDPQ